MRRAPLSLRAQALALLARREHSRQELRAKLQAHARKLAQAEAQAGARPPHDTGATRPHGAADALAADPHDDVDAQAARWHARIDALLDELQAAGHLSDERFAEVRVHARAAGQGQARIRRELARHGVELPDALAEALRGSELERAQALWLRRFGGGPAQDPRERARQMRFLAARGFSGEVVRRVTAGQGGADDPADDWHDPASE